MKRTFTIALIFVFILSAFMVVSHSESLVYGDMNGDGSFSPYDIIYMSRAVGGWSGYELTSAQKSLADVDGNGAVEAIDCVIASRNLADWIGYLKMPFSSDNKVNILMNESFNGTSLSSTKWVACPEWERQGNSVWDDDMSYLDGEGHLVLRAEWDASVSKVRCGAVRTMGKNYRPTFTGGLGYYEASIKFPLDKKGKGVTGIWGAFWMMCGDVEKVDGSSADGVEIDIIESISSDKGIFSSAMHWDGYGDAHKSTGSGDKITPKIYDGNFHKIALERTETATIFYVDGQETWRMTDGDKIKNQSYTYGNCTENGYMKLTIESAEWAYKNNGKTQADLIAALGDGVEMVVDYVRVYDKNPYR